MSENHYGGHIGVALLVAAIAFAFGARTARAVVAVALLLAGAAFLYVAFRVVSGTL